jgi:hypothetical protein
MQEWLNWHAWKVCKLERVSRVRIPFSPQINLRPTVGGAFLFYRRRASLLAAEAENKNEKGAKRPAKIYLLLPLQGIIEGRRPEDNPFLSATKSSIAPGPQPGFFAIGRLTNYLCQVT